ncbi:MAG: phospholipase D-like domain-containing protein [Pirellulales bacterium]
MPRKRLQLQSRVSRMLLSVPTPSWGPAPDQDFAVRFRDASALAERLGEFPLVAGNRVELLPDYDESVARLLDDIRAAKTHVHLLYYIFGDDDVGQKIEAALVDAVRRGVRCIVLIDALGSRKSITSLAPRLRAAGIETHVLLPGGFFRNLHKNAARYDLRNHRKIAVVDGSIAYVGSQNLVDKAFIPGLVYHELVARVTGPVVRQLQVVLLADRFYETEDLPRHEAGVFPDIAPAGDVAAQVLPSGPGYRQANNLRWITAAVYAAQRRIVLTTPYFVPDETLRKRLLRRRKGDRSSLDRLARLRSMARRSCAVLVLRRTA